MKKAFTLAEVLIVLAIMGILATLVSAVTVVTMPRKADVLFKRNYVSFTQAVYEVANDTYIYPNSDPNIPVLSEQNDLSDSDVLSNLTALFSVDKTPLNRNNYFCYAVASKMHLQERTVNSDGTVREICSECNGSAQNFSENFTTTDGTKFFGLCGQFHSLMGVDNEYRPIYLYVDAEKKSGNSEIDILKEYEKGSTFDGNKIRTGAGDTYVYRIFLNAAGQIIVNDEPEKTQVSRSYNNK